MERKYNNRRYLDALEERVLIFDGAMGTNLQKMNLTAHEFGGERTVGCNDYLVLSYPQAPLNVHRSFLETGVDVIETCTFRSNRLTLGEYGLADKVDLINRTAASIARKVADEFSTPAQPRFVAGSIGPSGKLPSMNDPELSNISIEDLTDLFREQAAGLIEGGVDLVLIETSQDILEVKTAIQGIWKAFEQTGIFLPIQVQVTLDTSGRMLLGTDISAVLAILEDLSIDVIGLNCSTGPEHMREPIQYLGAQSSIPVSCIPNAGLPLNVDGEAVYPLTPEEFASALGEFVEKYHINVVGGCCGTTPEHLKKLVERIHGRPNLPRPVLNIPLLASGIQAQPMLQEPRPFLIGERLNTQGSAKFKQIILDQNYDGILSIARQQVNSGAHGLDLCVALTERSDEAESMRRAVKVLAPVMRIPLVIDSTEPEVMETALKNYPGRCMLNSINLEAGEEKPSRILALAKKYNAVVIALTIDEQGMAKTAERKLEVARRIHALAIDKYGLHPQDIVFDALTFTLATGDPEYSQSAVDTLEGIRLIKSNLPGVLTSLGVSNVSFGLDGPTRAVLNSLMLYHSVLAGLDMAIVNPAQITPYAELSAEERELGEDLIFNRNPDALKNLIGYFQKLPADSGRVELQKSELAGMSPQERLHFKILHRLKEGVDLDIDEIVTPHPLESRHAAAIEVLNTVLLPAMKEVGDKFGSGELILPFVLQSAEVMKASVTHLEQYLEKMEGVSKGKVVLATVYGDVHDIGKNLVKTILSNNGYEVIDLGKQVPADMIITRAVEESADAIGLSALLVSTSRQMPLIVNELSLRKLNFPVLIGGAAINRRFGRRILQVEDGSLYPGGVFYCKDAFEGLSTMDQLSDKTRRQGFQEENRIESQMETGKEPSSILPVISVVKSNTSPAKFIPRPPAWGPKVVHSMPLEEVFNLLSIKELFRLSWGAKNAHGDVWKKMEEKFNLRLESMKKEALQTGWLRPQGVYGYYPCQADGNDLIVFESGSVEAGSPLEFKRFSFPRQPDQEHLCLADYFLPVASGKMDIVALQVVTVGREATERIDALNTSGEITEAYFSHGLAVQTAEASANYLHLHIRRELGMSPSQGKRYSWGYPAIPDLSDHAKVFELLPVENALDMRLTSAYQLIPEQSTAAIIVHHPAASYFNVAVGRSE